MTEQSGRIQTLQEHQKEAVLSPKRYKWHHIGLTVSGITFSAVVLIGIGGVYLSLDNKLETRISAVEHRISGIEQELSGVEQERSAGFAELKALVLILQKTLS